MKILLINNCHWRRGGSETVYFSTAEMLRKAGHEVIFFSLNDEKNIKTDFPEYFVKQGGVLKSMISYFANYDAAKKMEELLVKEKPNIAHVHLIWGGLSATIFQVLHKHGIPIVHTVHDYRMICPAYTFRNGRGDVCELCTKNHYSNCIKYKCAKGSLLQSLLMACEMKYRNHKWHPAKVLDGIIYVSYFAKQKHEEIDSLFLITKNIVLYNNTTVGDKYPPLEKVSDYFLYYGRLSGEKGVPTLVEAFARHPELKLKIVGTGPKEDELKQKKYTNVEFLGYKTGDELYNIVQNARFVCVPSEWYENNPMTIVEAYSMGTPVIGARIGGIPEIVEDGKTGFLFENGNIDSLDSAIEKSVSIKDESYKRMKHEAKLFAENYFNGQKYLDTLVCFYNDVIRSFKRNIN